MKDKFSSNPTQRNCTVEDCVNVTQSKPSHLNLHQNRKRGRSSKTYIQTLALPFSYSSASLLTFLLTFFRISSSFAPREAYSLKAAWRSSWACFKSWSSYLNKVQISNIDIKNYRWYFLICCKLIAACRGFVYHAQSSQKYK